jgi:SPP1 gp7 family putative phage head morphogenesis protein
MNLDKWNEEVEELSLEYEKDVDKTLFDFFKEALAEIKKRVKEYLEEYEKLSFSKRQEAQRLLAVAEQIEKILEANNIKVTAEIESYARQEAVNGYYGTLYSIEGAANIEINLPLINQRYIEQIVHQPVSGKVFSKRLYANTEKLAKIVTTELRKGAIRGDGYKKIAKRVEEQTEATYKRALRIARTEGGRVQSTAKQKAYIDARDKGVKLEKRWLATLDKKTRHSHQVLDGQMVPVDEQFTFQGYKADGPRLFGRASLDINCRCTTIAVVNGIEPELRKDNENKKIIHYTSYRNWLRFRYPEVRGWSIS